MIGSTDEDRRRWFSGVSQPNLVVTKLEELWAKRQDLTIVSGGADGPDKIAEDWARSKGIPVEIFPADWGRSPRCWDQAQRQNY